MASEFDLSSYLRRIGYSGGATPTLETLRVLHRCHTETLAFENLSSFAGLPVPLDVDSLQEKLVRHGRGGYCFEQNLLFWHALKTIGFSVSGLAARVVYGVPENVALPRTHMLLRIELDGVSYVADVGFGGLTLTAPLRLEADVEQSTTHEPFRLARSGERFVMEAKIAGAWKALYHFSLEEQAPADYEVMNWYIATHPQSRFVNHLIAARVGHDCRYALLNNELAIHHLDGRTERRTLSSLADLREALEEEFRLTLPEGPDLDMALARLLKRAEQTQS